MNLFRADGNSDIGSGHIMRCLAIADAWKRMGEQCTFMIADVSAVGLIKKRGHEVVVLNTDYRDMESELDVVRILIQKFKPMVMVVDSYAVTKKYLTAVHDMVHQTGGKVVYMDDILSFAYPCDCLLDYSIYGMAKEKEYRKLYADENVAVPSFLLGTLYVPLRYEFQGLPDRIVRQNAKNILVSTGGADVENIAIEVVKTIKTLTLGEYTFHLIIGSMNGDAEQIERLADGEPNIVLHQNVNSMCALMISCDVAISAAGSTLYELCATQTPTITYILADNQIPGADGFERHGVLRCIGDVRKTGAGTLAGKLVCQAIALCKNYDERVKIAKAMSKIVDGYGANRIVGFVKNI